MNHASHYRVRHRTRYRYGASVVHAHQLLHLTPRSTPQQAWKNHSVEISPVPSCRRSELDPFGNTVTRLELDRPHRELDVVATMEIALQQATQINPEDTLAWERVRDDLAYANRPRSPRDMEACLYRMESPHTRIKSAFEAFAGDCFARGAPVLVCAIALMEKIYKQFEYAPGETSIGIPLLQVLEKKRGVCQDFAHLMIASLRSQGLAARYVSGYLRTATAKDEQALTGADASHAWVSVYAPPLGWVDLDPTNNVLVAMDHITLAWGRDFGDVSPLRGVIVGGGQHALDVSVSVQRTE
jgi:transglutaminase-like putative cysteine protease